eukprot:356523-Chlamydomonas_euryale.AAC.4
MARPSHHTRPHTRLPVPHHVRPHLSAYEREGPRRQRRREHRHHTPRQVQCAGAAGRLCRQLPVGPQPASGVRNVHPAAEVWGCRGNVGSRCGVGNCVEGCHHRQPYVKNLTDRVSDVHPAARVEVGVGFRCGRQVWGKKGATCCDTCEHGSQRQVAGNAIQVADNAIQVAGNAIQVAGNAIQVAGGTAGSLALPLGLW